MKVCDLRVNKHNMAICQSHKIRIIRDSDCTKDATIQRVVVNTILTFDDILLYSNRNIIPRGIKYERVSRFVDEAIADKIVDTAISLGYEYIRLTLDYFKKIKEDVVLLDFKKVYSKKIDILEEQLKNTDNLKTKTENMFESTEETIFDETDIILMGAKEFNNLESTSYYLTEKQQKRLYERKK